MPETKLEVVGNVRTICSKLCDLNCGRAGKEIFVGGLGYDELFCGLGDEDLSGGAGFDLVFSDWGQTIWMRSVVV